MAETTTELPESPSAILAALASIGITPNTEPNEEPWVTVTEPMGEEPADTLADALGKMLAAAETDGRDAMRGLVATYTKRAVFDAASQSVCECLRLHREGVPPEQWRVDHNAVLVKALAAAQRAEDAAAIRSCPAAPLPETTDG